MLDERSTRLFVDGAAAVPRPCIGLRRAQRHTIVLRRTSVQLKTRYRTPRSTCPRNPRMPRVRAVCGHSRLTGARARSAASRLLDVGHQVSSLRDLCSWQRSCCFSVSAGSHLTTLGTAITTALSESLDVPKKIPRARLRRQCAVCVHC